MVHDGESGLDNGLTGIYDVILLDIMLPVMDGISVLKELRREKIETPVILLTAKGEIADKICGLDSGADDYLAKPFNTDELLARIRSVSRRRGEIVQPDSITCGGLTVDMTELVMRNGAKSVNLTLKEFEMLDYFIKNREQVLSKEQIIEKLWGFESEAEANHVEVYVSFLRKKLKFLSSNVSINTVRGVGYRLTVQG